MSAVDDTPTQFRGNLTPVAEEITLTDLEVIGEIPAELDGRYVRNGPNPITGESDHPFLGDGMIHGVRLRDGNAEWYRNRYVQTPHVANPDLPFLEVGEDLHDLTASKANTNIVGHSGALLALEEGHFPYVLDGELETVGPTDFEGGLVSPFSAHPKLCPVTGEMLSFGYAMFEPYLTYLRVSADGNLVQSTPITVGGPTMMHDFNITQNHAIFMDLPAVFDFDLAMKGEMPIRWSDDYPARLGVMPRDGDDSQVTWYDVDPCYVFHPMNAFEDGDKIVLDVARLPYVWRDGALDFPDPSLHRWTIDTSAGTVHEAQVDDRPAEFPRVADARVGLEYRYGYMMLNNGAKVIDAPMSVNGGLLKYDLDTGGQVVLDVGRGRHPGEAVFVPAAGGHAEDDGYLMTYVFDAESNTSEFAIFDASTMSSDPVAAVKLPRVPLGFHGNWVPSTQSD